MENYSVTTILVSSQKGIDKMLKLPLNKRILAIRILRQSNFEDYLRRKNYVPVTPIKELTDDEFYGMLL